MNQDNLKNEIASLERRIKLLVDQYNSLKEENNSLREENEHLKEIIQNKDIQLDNFQNSIKLSKIASKTVTNNEDTGELKRTITEYIKEIDRCISHLNQ